MRWLHACECASQPHLNYFHLSGLQGEMATRIDENVEDTLANVDAGQAQLLKYLSAISSNRWVAVAVGRAALVGSKRSRSRTG